VARAVGFVGKPTERMLELSSSISLAGTPKYHSPQMKLDTSPDRSPRSPTRSARGAIHPTPKLADVNNLGDVEIPHHLQRCLKQLRATADALGETTHNLHCFTQGELFTADKKARVLVQAQRDTLRDLTFFCEREIRFLKSKAMDATRASPSSGAFNSSLTGSASAVRPRGGGAADAGCIALYGALTATARSHGASSAAIFSGSHGESLDLLALIRSQPIDAINCGVESDIFRVCQTVAKLKCAVNLFPQSTPTGLSESHDKVVLDYSSLLGAPIFSPVSPSLVMGVVVLWDKVPVPGNPLRGFSRQDEAATERLAAQAAQLMALFNLGGHTAAGMRISPLAWEGMWTAGTSLPTVLCTGAVNPPPRRFVFRHDGEKATSVFEQSQKEDTSVRHVIDSVSAFQDMSQYAEQLQKDVAALQQQLAAQRADVSDAERQKHESFAQAESAIRCANLMRIANERLLRNTFVQRIPQDDVIVASAADLVAPVQQGYTFIASPPAAGRTGPKSAKRTVALKRN
jgi:hypothetical protein